MRTATVLALLLVLAAPARADCDHFKWPLAQEKLWFAQAPEPIEAGAEIALEPHAFELTLKPAEAAAYVLPPKKPAGAGEFGGTVRVSGLPKAGLYQITLSREAWVDVIQSGARAKTRNVSRQRDCPAFAKSVRFQLAAGPAIVQFSGVGAPTVAFAIATAP